MDTHQKFSGLFVFTKRNFSFVFEEVWNVVYDPNKPVVMTTWRNRSNLMQNEQSSAIICIINFMNFEFTFYWFLFVFSTLQDFYG